MGKCRILLVTFPGQGHINPSLQFAKRLVRMGVEVTFSTSVSAIHRMTKTIMLPEGLTFAPFSDGYDNGWTDADNSLMSDFQAYGSKAVAELITVRANEGCPFTHVVYTTLLAWVANVARRLHVPATLLWIQPAAILDIYYYYFNGYGDKIRKNDINEVPGLPPLASHDLPTFMLSSNSDIYSFALPTFREHFEGLDEETNPRILINSFDALEARALKAIEKYSMKAIGPLIPSAFLDGKDPSDTSFGGDLFQKSRDYMEWLTSKPESSVVYVSFGTMSVLSKEQMEEIGLGLLESHRPFLWVIRTTNNGEKLEDKLSCLEELEKLGLIVPWCSQLEVLSHPSVGCSVMHCGWNSTLESLVTGLPVVGFPQWSDQPINAKLIEDVWKTGVRVKMNEEGLVKGSEIKRCLELVMGVGDKGKEMRENAKKWKDLAREAVKDGGSSDLNLKAFLDEIRDNSN